jgi:hypothetical protein
MIANSSLPPVDGGAQPGSLILVQNFFEELRQVVPDGWILRRYS